MKKIFLWEFHIFNLIGALAFIFGTIMIFISLNKNLLVFVISNLLVSLGLTLMIITHVLLTIRQNYTIEQKLDIMMDTIMQNIFTQTKGRAK